MKGVLFACLMTMSLARFIPHHVRQEDGSQCQWSNCWAAVGAWILSGVSRAQIDDTPTQFRASVPTGMTPPCRGGTLDDIVSGLNANGKPSNQGLHTRVELKSALASADSTKLFAMPTDFASWPNRGLFAFSLCLFFPQ